MDFENNGQDVTKFMHKVKKQAKRLFQLSKTNSNNLQINSLSKAQEILAQINGYPDWHALEKHISGSKNILFKEQESKIELQRHSYENLYYLETNDSVSTFLRCNTFPSNVFEIQKSIHKFNDMFSFQINMGLHDISLFIEQKQKNTASTINYSLYTISRSFNLSEEEAKKFFYIENSKTEQIQPNTLTFYILITSKQKHKEEHLNLCLSMLNSKLNENGIIFESVPSLSQEQLKSFEMKNAIDNTDFTNSLLNNPIKNPKDGNTSLIVKWVYLLNFLSDKKIGFSLKYSLIDKTIVYKFENYEKFNELIDNFIQSSIKTQNFNYQELKYFSKPNYNYVSNNEMKGLTLKSTLNNDLFYFNDRSTNRVFNVDFIYGKPGTGKSVLSNIITLGSLLDKDLNSIPKLGIIDIGLSYQGLVSLFKNILPVEMRSMVKQINVENSKEYAINIFDLPLGKRKYDNQDVNKITQVLTSLFTKEEGLTGLLSATVFSLNEMIDKKYVPQQDILIDSALKKYNINGNNIKTWWQLTDLFISKGEEELALKSHKYAMPLMSDFMTVLNSPIIKDIYGKIIIHTGENLISYVNRVLVKMIQNYPFINTETKINLDNTKIALFNLEKVTSFKEKEIQDYWFSSILHLISYHFMGIGKDTFSSSKNSFYEAYNKKNNSNNLLLGNKIIIDELHRFSQNSNVMEQLLSLVRDLRTYNVAMSIATQSLADIDIFKDYITGYFIANISSQEASDLRYLDFDHNEIELMKNMKFPSWAVKLMTKKGRVFDIVKLEMTDHLKFATSSTLEDIIIKKELLKNLNYMQMLDKTVNYLRKNNFKSFKQLFELENDNNKKNEEIIKDLVLKITKN